MKNQTKLIFITIAAAFVSLVLTIILTPPAIVKPVHNIEEVAVRPGDTLSSILKPRGLAPTDIMDIANLLRRDAGVRNLKANCDIIRVARAADSGPVDRVVIKSDTWREIEFVKTAKGWECRPRDIEKEIKIVRREGVIRDGDSFYSSGVRAGIPESVLADAYDLLAFEMDFERDMRDGQRFEILYEENYAGGAFVNTGAIIAVVFDAGGRRGQIRMYRFNRTDGRAGYYDEAGGGAIKSLKRTPINNARVTSSFSGARKHPVLGFTRAHRGVDFRAAHGTPIPAAGAGRVVARGTNAGYGNFIRMRHNATYETLYAHLSRFVPGVGAGTQVRQGQIVGYVGNTGISTGAHLHYEIIKNGERVNPMSVKLPAIDSLGDADRARFLELRESLDKSLEIMKDNPGLEL